MVDGLAARAGSRTIPITPVDKPKFDDWHKRQSAALKRWVDSAGFKAASGSVSLIAGDDGALSRVLLGVDPEDDFGSWGGLSRRLPEGSYRVDTPLPAARANVAALAWALGAYRFGRYRKDTGRDPATLVWPDKCDRAAVTHAVEATVLARDLINTPTEDMGPAQLAQAARSLARRHKARISVITGKALQDRNYPTIHAVGRASANAPRLIDLQWGARTAPRVTLVGKGVCFDTGGLDLKPPTGMLRMKKDMGGAANVLGLAHMIMAARLPVRLRVLIPAVENSVAGNAYRPLDVIRTRKGITVEIGNTDAEGRLILCDALAEADREKPTLIVDFATLTGAARVALGADLPALFCNDDKTAEALLGQGLATGDPLWRMPLHKPYRKMLDSKVADINNVSEGGQGGAITAALYLQEFVSAETPWVHIDLMAWNASDRPGRPTGGEAQGMRAAFGMIEARFGRKKRRR